MNPATVPFNYRSREMMIMRFVSYIPGLVLAAVLGVCAPDEAPAVGGLSNSKVNVTSAETVPRGHLEVEPAFNLTFVTDGRDTRALEAGARFTLGITDVLEAGLTLTYLTVSDDDSMSADADFGDTQVGMKLRFIDQGRGSPFSLAYEGGLTIPTGGDDNTWTFEPAALVLTRDFTERLSLDIDSGISLIAGDREPDAFGFQIEAGVGYFVTGKLQPVVELAYELINPEGSATTNIITLTAGFTAPLTERVVLTVGVLTDLYAGSAEEEVTFTSALAYLF